MNRLVTSDRAPGVIKAIEVCFARAARQRCLAHRMRNLAAKVPEDVWPEFKVRVQAAYQAPIRPIACELAAGVVADVDENGGGPGVRLRKSGRSKRLRLPQGAKMSGRQRLTAAPN
jgi:hypothetical protein